jgi:hypothetical protein
MVVSDMLDGLEADMAACNYKVAAADIEGAATADEITVEGDSIANERLQTRSQCHEREGAVKYSDASANLIGFFRELYPALHEWVQWFLQSQRGPSDAPGSFRWRGRQVEDNKLIANTMASGLDDYPRSPLPSSVEYHLDLQCWMIFATQVMARLADVLTVAEKAANESSKGSTQPSFEELSMYEWAYAIESETPDIGLLNGDAGGTRNYGEAAESIGARYYGDLYRSLQNKLVQLHWSDQYPDIGVGGAFMDVGLFNASSGILVEVITRCQQPTSRRLADFAIPAQAIEANPQQSPCPADYPQLLFYHRDEHGNRRTRERFVSGDLHVTHIPRVGYLSLFPLLLKQVEPSSAQLVSLLDLMQSEAHMWTPFGLCSISKSDQFYRKGNAPGDEPYWR